MDHQSGLADVNGTQLFFEIAGTGDALVFIHGFGSDRRVWDDQFDTFAQHYQVLRYDLRGHGKSALPTQEPYAHADDLKALLNHFGIQRVHLIGQSFGGEIALNFTLTYPESVQSLILVDTSLGGHQWSEEWVNSWIPVGAAASTRGKEGVLELVLKHPLIAPAMQNPRVNPKLTQIFSDYSAWHFLNTDTVQYLEPPAAQRLDQIKTRTLIILGEDDLLDYHSIAAQLEQIPNAKRVNLPCGHVVPMEVPEQFNQIVLNSLATKQ